MLNSCDMPNTNDFPKLIYIIGTYPLLTTTFIDREVQRLRELGLHIEIVSIRRPPVEVSQVEAYRDMQRQIAYLLPVDRAKFALAHLYFALLHPLAYFGLLAFLCTRPHPTFRLRLKTLLHFAEGVYAAYLLRQRDFDQAHAHFIDRAATVALCVGRLLKKPYSLTAHANDIYMTPVLVREKIAASRFTVTVSEFNKAYLLQHNPGLPADKIFVLHPWVDLSRFKPPETRAERDRLRILSVGRLVEKKGHHHLIAACGLLQQSGLDFECHILGDGPMQPELEARIAQHGLTDRVHLLGARPQAEVLARLGKADVFALACVVAASGDRDGMPVALAEAMAMELPVVSTDLVGIKELVRPGSGYLTSPGDVAALAGAIRAMHQAGVPGRAAMGKLGRQIVAEDFDVNEGIRRLAELFQNKS